MVVATQAAVDLWSLDCAGFELSALEATWLSVLSDAERTRYDRYAPLRSKRQLLLSRAMLRSVLTHYLGTSAFDFGLGEHGRPELAGALQSDLSFNLSHSRDRVVVAVTRAGVIGVDVEYAGRVRRIERLISRYFSPSEQEALMALPEQFRLERFYALWALKEAYIKARGLGLAIPLADFSFDFSAESEAVSIRFDGSLLLQAPTQWSFWRGSVVGADYALGLALQTPEGKAGSVAVTLRESIRAEGSIRQDTGHAEVAQWSTPLAVGIL